MRIVCYTRRELSYESRSFYPTLGLLFCDNRSVVRIFAP
jgi:hypothetical protein